MVTLNNLIATPSLFIKDILCIVCTYVCTGGFLLCVVPIGSRCSMFLDTVVF